MARDSRHADFSNCHSPRVPAACGASNGTEGGVSRRQTAPIRRVGSHEWPGPDPAEVPRGRSSPPSRWRHTPALAAARQLGLAWGGRSPRMGPRRKMPRGMTRGSGRAGGDPGNGGLRTWSGRERSSHKHRLHVRGRTSPAHPGPCPDLTATARRPSPHIGPHLPSPRPDGACLVARAQATTPIPEPDEPSSYTVVARRYRPQRFEEVVGQDHVVQVAPQRHPAEQGDPRLPVQRDPGRRQDVGRPHLRQVPELRPRADRGPLPGLRHLPGRSPSGRTSTSSRSTGRATTGSRRSASSARTPACGRAAPGTRSTTSTKSTCSPRAPSTPS